MISHADHHSPLTSMIDNVQLAVERIDTLGFYVFPNSQLPSPSSGLLDISQLQAV